ncbi:MAG: hypothetical protein QNJ54_02595 [Prochloraceae cyanobacterium]|nr:hypothetical protein [Prochloraceae cyanobacterium]
MSTEEEARKLMVEQRQHDDRLEENMSNRAHQEVETHTQKDTEEEARELMARQRQHDQQTKENLLSRANEEIK